MILDDAVRQESAAVYRFVSALVDLCDSIAEYPVYTNPSRKFFDYVKLLGGQTQQFLSRFPEEVKKNPKTAFSKRQKLLELRNSWETIHEYLKAALDADTLHLPTPLILAFQQMINKIEDLEKMEFTVFHAAEVNYLQIPAETFREIANGIADAIKGEHFPPDLGLIGLPYSQAAGFFLNCLLPHEMGHFVYQEVFLQDVEPEIDKSLEKMEIEVAVLDEEDISLCRDMLGRWIEEIFCDLFALCIIGPAYSFALIELTGSMLLVERPASTLDEFFFFIEDHPAEIARFDAHVKILDALGWWGQLKDSQSPSVEVLQQAIKMRSDVHIEGALPVDEKRLLQCYEEVLEWLLRYISTKIPSDRTDIDRFPKHSEIIAKYFRDAVVPSTIIVEDKSINPNPIMLINSAFRFYTESLPTLIENVADGQPESVAALSEFTERLELWVLKAIEDSRLLEREKH